MLTPEGNKWWTAGGAQVLYDLDADPGETEDLAPAAAAVEALSAYPTMLEESLGQEVRPVWRISERGRGQLLRGFTGRIELAHPDGIAQAWHPSSAMGGVAALRIEDGALVVEAERSKHVPREIFVLPAGEVTDVAGLTLVVTSGQQRWEATVAPGADAESQPLIRAGKGKAAFTVGPHLGPLPRADENDDEDEQLAAHEDLSEQLRALGYLD